MQQVSMLQNDAAVKISHAIIIIISVIVAVVGAVVTVIKRDEDLGVGGEEENLRPVNMTPLFPWPPHLGIKTRIWTEALVQYFFACAF